MDKVLVDGVDVTALVDGVLTDWQSSKTLSFADSATDLTVCGSDLIAIDRSGGEFWCPDGDMTACAGFALSCSGGRWDGVATDTTWLVTAQGTDPSALVPDANSETLAVASTSPFAWGAAGDKIWSAAADEAACFTKVIAPDLPNDWWVTHFAEGKIPSGHNKVPPEGYEPIDGAGPCRCQGSGTNLDSCGDTVNGDPAAGEGTLCCDGSPYTNPNPGAAGLTSGANRFYIGDSTSGQICYKPIGSEDAPIGSEDAPIGSDNGNNPSPRPPAGPAPRPADNVTRAHYKLITRMPLTYCYIVSIDHPGLNTLCPDRVRKSEAGPLYSYPPAQCTGTSLDDDDFFLGLSACPTCEQEWDLTDCANVEPGTLCGVLVCKGSSGSGNKSSGGKVAASTSYIIVIVILAVLLFASLCYIIVKQRAERAAPHSRKSMPTISDEAA